MKRTRTKRLGRTISGNISAPVASRALWPIPTAIVSAMVLALACKGDGPAGKAPKPATQRQTPAPLAADGPPCAGLDPRPARYPAAPRIVAIGDLHGDIRAARRALVLAGAIDSQDHWIGGDLVVVQTGDILDRGDDEQAIIDLFERLARDAADAGGAVYALLGNHETMNAAGDFRYVTRGGFADFRDVPGLDIDHAALAGVPPEQRPRMAALAPGGVYAHILARHDAVAIVGDTVFAHGGVLPKWADYGIDRLNRDIRCWLQGASPRPAVLKATDNPMWSRHYATSPEPCAVLERALVRLNAARMVVGHTIQKGGISSACGGKVWRIDVGMAAHYGGPTEILEIRGSAVRVLR